MKFIRHILLEYFETSQIKLHTMPPSSSPLLPPLFPFNFPLTHSSPLLPISYFLHPRTAMSMLSCIFYIHAYSTRISGVGGLKLLIGGSFGFEPGVWMGYLKFLFEGGNK